MTGIRLRGVLHSVATRGLIASSGIGLAIIAQASFGAVPDEPKASVAFANGDAESGRKLYGTTCASCHGAQLEGAAGPTLKGTNFASRWLPPTHPESVLLTTLTRMPLQAPGSLTQQQYADLARFLVTQSGTEVAEATPAAPSNISFPTTPVKVERSAGTGPDDADIASPAASDWMVYNRDYKGQRYSPLAQINRSNVAQLRPTCLFQLGEIASFQTSPVVYQGRMYLTTARFTYAINAKTCRTLWKTEHPAIGREVIPSSRGAAVYRGKLFRGTPDGRLLALDAQTGKVLWELRVADSARGSFVSLAPIAAQGMVFVGEAGADWGANGHLHAFNVETGALVWTFDVIPTGNQPGAETWSKGSEVGGGSIWTSLAYDPASKTVFASVGNPASDYDASKRPGDNLYTNSVVALDAATGKLQWYVQQRPHDTRDYDTAAAPVLYEAGGKPRMAVGSKGGLLYFYDRDSRRLLTTAEVSSQENGDTPLGSDPIHVCPGQLGGVEWNGPAHDPRLGALFINSVDWCGMLKLVPEDYVVGRIYFGGKYTPDPIEKATGWTRAFDAATGKPLWAYHSPTPMIAGVTPTAGGVVFTGDLNGDLIGFDGMTGKILYRYNTGGAIAGGISSYSVDGTQYIAVASGNANRTGWRTTGSPTILVFALPH